MHRVSLNPIGDEIWEYCHDIRFRGIALPHRMTIIRLPETKLLLHSPTRCEASTMEALSRIGTITDLVAPNRYHDLFLEDWLAAVPEARLWIPPGMHRRFPRALGRIHEISQESPWGQIDCVPLKGLPRLNEWAFLHSASKALIIADLLFNIDAHARLATRAAARLGGFYQRLAMPLDMKLWHIRDRNALKQSVEQIMNSPFDKIIVGHGANIDSDGKAAFKRALQWLY